MYVVLRTRERKLRRIVSSRLRVYRLSRQFERYGDVGKLVLSNVRRFCSGKKPSDDVFNKLTVRWQVGTRCPLTSSLTCA